MLRPVHAAVLLAGLSACATEAPPEPAEMAAFYRGPADFVGRTYVIDLGATSVVSPAGVGPFIEPSLAGATTLPAVTVLSIDPSTRALQLRLGAVTSVGGTWRQDACVATSDSRLPGDASAAPRIQVVFPGGEFQTAGAVVDLEGARVTGTLSKRPAELAATRLEGRMDMRAYDSLFPPGTTGTACSYLASFAGVSCTECSPRDGRADRYCLDVRFAEIDAPELVGLSLARVTPADVRADPACP